MNLVFWLVFLFSMIAFILFEFLNNKFGPFKNNTLSETQITVIKEILYYFVMEAEARFGSGTGEAKFAFVIHKFYTSCPEFLKKMMVQNNFNFEEMIIEFLEESVNRMRKYFLDNPFAKERLI